MKRGIEKLGGLCQGRVEEDSAACFATKETLEEMGTEIKRARKFDVQVTWMILMLQSLSFNFIVPLCGAEWDTDFSPKDKWRQNLSPGLGSMSLYAPRDGILKATCL